MKDPLTTDELRMLHYVLSYHIDNMDRNAPVMPRALAYDTQMEIRYLSHIAQKLRVMHTATLKPPKPKRQARAKPTTTQGETK